MKEYHRVQAILTPTGFKSPWGQSIVIRLEMPNVFLPKLKGADGVEKLAFT